jgi:hypothetical protein
MHASRCYNNRINVKQRPQELSLQRVPVRADARRQLNLIDFLRSEHIK